MTQLEKRYAVKQIDNHQLSRLLNIQRVLDECSIVAITDIKGIITYANKEFCRISKYSEKELTGQNHRILKSGHHSSEFYRSMWDTITSGEIWRGELKNKAKDGTFYWVKTIIVPLLDKQGKPTEYLSIRTDITKEKELQQKILDDTDKLVKSEKFAVIGELSSRLAHDLRNPITVIKNEIELAKLKLDEKEKSKINFRILEDSLNSISKQLEGVLDFVRTKPLDLCNNPLEKIIASVVSQIAVPSGISIITHKTDLQCYCDAKQLEIALMNLITNSIQAVGENGWIEIKTEKDDSAIIIEISDSGAGIPQELRSKVWEPLFTTKPNGTGLGLASVENVITRHGGTISIRDNPTTFRIILPQSSLV